MEPFGSSGTVTQGETWLRGFLTTSGLVPTGFDASMAPLTGGVASDIWRVQGPEKTFVVKRALARLRVTQEWSAPVSRNASEVLWMRTAAEIVPDAVPEILAHDPVLGAFAMEYLDPADHPVWKEQLQRGHVAVGNAVAVGRAIAAIHAGTAFSPDTAERFANDAVFLAIRLDPYLEATARAHPKLASALLALSADTLGNKVALVHGDMSPKNILMGPKGPVILDAECAWFGEPAFDLAFCLNHLLLKCLAAPTARPALIESFRAMASAYFDGVDWEPAADLERRAARLLPALLLARVDGKSPVEYVTDETQKDHVRRVATPLILSPPFTLAPIAAAWDEELSR